MELNWSTFLLEIINFLILVWILKRFFYKPVLDVIARRRADIEKTLDDAKVLHNDAETLQEQYKNRLAVWEQERLAAQTALEEEIEAERARQMEALQSTLEKEREKAQVIDQRQLEACRQQAEEAALTQGAQFAARLLTTAAGPELEKRLADLFMQELATLSPEQTEVLRAAGNKASDKIRITSTYSLDDAARQLLEQSLNATLGISGPFHYTQDKALLAGLRINVGAWVLHATLQDELKSFVDFAHDA